MQIIKNMSVENRFNLLLLLIVFVYLLGIGAVILAMKILECNLVNP